MENMTDDNIVRVFNFLETMFFQEKRRIRLNKKRNRTDKPNKFNAIYPIMNYQEDFMNWDEKVTENKEQNFQVKKDFVLKVLSEINYTPEIRDGNFVEPPQ
jgi:hypothetical protein